MCGRFTLKTPASRVAELFDTLPTVDIEPRYNIAPTQEIVACRRQEPGPGRELVRLRWGLVPSWGKDLSQGVRAINARSETAREKPTFRSSFSRRRCLVPADGFFEWKLIGKRKQPFYVRFDDARLFAMAGLWDRWSGEGRVVDSVTILTTEPSPLLASLHDRMPVILPPKHFDAWLTGKAHEEILIPFDEPSFRPIPVSSIVNNVRHDGPECIEPIRLDQEGSLW
jgi:putative SOS response-associated peptidase YedK